ncbi:hypothetical protein PV326_007456 [Microctonus aethiopoides]|nr:hypothetical protein PV326_007456 [Microctonus aethiopoides]
MYNIVNIFFFINIITVNTQNFRLQNILELNNNKNWSTINYYERSKNIFPSWDNECSRYCIEISPDRIFKHAVVLWNIAQHKLLAFNDESTKYIDDSDTINKPTICAIYVNIGCKNSTFTNGLINNFTTGVNDEKIFIVNNGTEILKATIAERKKNSSLLFEIPLESNKIENDAVLELSLMRNTLTDELQMIIINPSPGKWRIKFTEIDTINFINNNHNTMSIKKFITSMMTSKSVDLPVQLQSRSAENFEINIDDDNENQMEINKNNTEIFDKFSRIISNNEHNEMIINERISVYDDLTQATNNLLYRMKTVTIDLALETKLFASPNTVHPIIFTVKNYLPLVILYTFRASSTKFPITAVIPPLGWMKPYEIFKVAVYIRIPNINENIVNTVSLHVQHESNNEDITKSAYVYVQNPNTAVQDYTKPTINYSFNNNCAGKLGPADCDDSEWSTEISVIDNESGVKNVVSQPDGIQPKMNFIAGMKGTVNLQYRATCCYTTVQITAIDIAGNSYTREIDVTGK